MSDEPRNEHRWLDKLVGEWTYEGECVMGPDQPPMKSEGSEVVRSVGGLWTIGEGESDMPEGGKARTVMTLGYDPVAGRFVGTFVASMMTHLWTYTGALDETGTVLVLDAEGPSFQGNGTARYQDSITILDDDHRVLSSRVQGEDGQWIPFMKATYSRRT